MVNILALNKLAAAVASATTTASTTPTAPAPSTTPAANLTGSFLLKALQTDRADDTDLPYIFQVVQTWMTNLTPEKTQQLRRRIFVGLLLAGGTKLAYDYYQADQKRKHYQKVKSQLSQQKGKDVSAGPPAPTGVRPGRVAVDAVFLRRLINILRICVPSPATPEFIDIVILSALLISRTMFSIVIAELVGLNAQSLVSRKWNRLFRGIGLFAAITVPAAAVNSGLKYFQEIIALRFRVRLSRHVHDEYLEGVNFYKASNISTGEGGRIENADQRVTADIDNFCTEISKLYSSLLKPLLDVVLFTYKLALIVGYQGPLAMHSYFVMSALIKKRVMPNLGKLVAKESELEGYYRTAHQRVIVNSEEIAFYGGASKEKRIINQTLDTIYKHVSFHRYLRAMIGIFDQLLIKYWASIAGYAALTAPLVLNLNNSRDLTSTELTRDYIRNSQYLGNLSTAVADLVIVGNKLVSIAGYTSRVSELLEQVQLLNSTENKPFTIKANVDGEDSSASGVKGESLANLDKLSNWIESWKKRCDSQRDQRYKLREGTDQPEVVGGGQVVYDNYIEFKNVDIVSPEGKLLVKQLNFRVDPGVNVMITGPNGVGKSSLFRVIGSLWPLHNGRLVKPHAADVLFVPQKPYLVLGTLRDQILYPHSVADMKALGVADDDLAHLLAIVDPAQNILTEWSFDTVKDWFHAFSGGQKQRVAMARLFYHRPRYAILDECTSAVSDEVEDTIYMSCRKLGITIFTVSHRPNLARHHEIVLRFEGRNGAWSVKNVSDNEKAQAQEALDNIKAASGATSAPTVKTPKPHTATPSN